MGFRTVGIAALALGSILPQLVSGQVKKPNVLFIMSDQHNADVLGFLGHPDVKTPNLDALAADGVFYTRAYCQNGICTPSRTSIFTGRTIRDLQFFENTHNALPHSFDYFPLHQELKANGYFTGCFGKRHLTQIIEDGFDKTATIINPSLDPSDENYKDWMTNIGRADEYTHDYVTTETMNMNCSLSSTSLENRSGTYAVNKTIDFLKIAKTTGKPFFCWTTFLHPHQPYTPIEQFTSMYNQNAIKLPTSIFEPAQNVPAGLYQWRIRTTAPWCLSLAAADVDLYRQYISYYYALVTEVDYQIGQIISYLKAEGLYDNTIIVYVSDHGDFVGGHGMIEKCAAGHNVYEETLRVPLIIKPTGECIKGERKDLVELIDLYPTLLELTDIDQRDTSLVGKSLVKNLTEKTPLDRKYAVSENGSQISIITDQYKYGEWIYNPKNNFKALNKDMFFDRQTDPNEVSNQIDNPDYATQKALLKSYLASYSQSIDTFWYSLEIGYNSSQSQNYLKVINNISLPTTYKGKTISWSSGDPSVLSNSGVVNRPKSADNVWVNLIATTTVDGKPKSESFSMQIISVKTTTALNSIYSNEDMIQFHHLSKNNLTLHFAEDVEQKVSIFSVIGQIIVNKKFTGSDLEVSLPRGVYIINLSNKYGNFNKKVFIAN